MKKESLKYSQNKSMKESVTLKNFKVDVMLY